MMSTGKDGRLVAVLKDLCQLYALYNMSVEMKHLLQEGVLAPEHSAWVDELIKDSLLLSTLQSCPVRPHPLSCLLVHVQSSDRTPWA